MKKVDTQDSNKVLNLIKKITFEVEKVRPSREKMIEEIKMMKFKIRPLAGDIFDLAKEEVGFLESLWKIGKIDRIINEGLNELSESEKETFFQYLGNFHHRIEKKLSSAIKKLSPEEIENIKVVELEVFRERKARRKNLN